MERQEARDSCWQAAFTSMILHWRILVISMTIALAAIGSYVALQLRASREHGFCRKEFVSKALQQKQDYVIFIPDAYGYGGTDTYPLLICLHDAWETYKSPIKIVQGSMGPAITARKKDFPFFVLFPKSQDGNWRPNSPDLAFVNELLAHTEGTYRIDPQRIFLTGRGAGAVGALHLAAANPRRWAAIVPVSPTSFEVPIEKIKPVPCWCFLASNDSPKLADNTRHWIAELRAAGAQPRLTELEGTGIRRISIADQVYANFELFAWLLQQGGQ